MRPMIAYRLRKTPQGPRLLARRGRATRVPIGAGDLSAGAVTTMRTLVLNANYMPRALVPLERAFALQFSGSDGGHVVTVLNTFDVEAAEIPNGVRVWRSPGGRHPVPLVLALTRMRNPAFDLPNVRVSRPTLPTVYLRDRGRCLYCGRTSADLGGAARLEVDHVVPRSRFARPCDAHAWSNVALACRPCNQRKGARTPDEADMRLLAPLRAPSRWDLEQDRLLECQRRVVDGMGFPTAPPRPSSQLNQGAA